MSAADEQPFLALLNEHQGILHRVCQLYAPVGEERRDLFQEMVVQLWRAWPNYRQAAKVTTWMYQIALNTAISTLRRSKRGFLRVDWNETLSQVPQPGPDGAYAEEVPRLYRAIARLSDVEKAIALLYLDDLSYDEIATIAGITTGNARVKMNRIREKLRVLLESDEL